MVRFAKANDIEFVKKIWQTCFDDPVEFVDWNFSRNYLPENTIIAEYDQKKAANMQLMPHRINLRGMEYDINYVSGVATYPEFRHKGLVRRMYEFAFPEMLRRRQPISLLVPFNYEFYEKFGYKQCYNKVFRYADNLVGNMHQTTELSSTLIESLNNIYRRNMCSKNGYAIRSTLDWQRILEDLLLISKGRVLIHSTRSVEDGYALVTQRAQGDWELHEVCGECTLTFKEELKPFAMARIIDPLRLLKDLSYNFEDENIIEIVDENIPQNNISVRLAKGIAEKTNQKGTKINIRELAEIIFDFGNGKSTLLPPAGDNYINMIF